MDRDLGLTQGADAVIRINSCRRWVIELLGLAVWLGLVSGFAELGAFVLVRARSGEVWPYFAKVRAYPWMIPLVDLTILILVANLFIVAKIVRPRMGGRVPIQVLTAVAITPALLVLGPNLYAGAVALLALGVASVAVPIVRNRPLTFRWAVRLSLPVLIAGFLGMVAWRETPKAAPAAMPKGGSQRNVLLIVLDTVRADHMSPPLGSSDRDTSPRIASFARTGVILSGARATAPWTLPTHASLMTGRWEFEVTRGRYGALEPGVPTLAEVFTREGFDTVGMVANLFFCPYFTGLDRGFSRYEDIPLTLPTALSSTVLGARIVDALGKIESILSGAPPTTFQRLPRIDGRTITDRFVRWVDGRNTDDRPFFAFLNYFDAHDPYIVPEGSPHRFGEPPASEGERAILENWWLNPEKRSLSREQITQAADGYDSCLFALDEQVGRLLDALDSRGVLDETVVVITSDHGEAFGEHGLFGHGGSLYEDQLLVPLVIVSPGIVPAETRINKVVSLRDLPATILDLAGLPDSPLPGHSLASLWKSDSNRDAPHLSPSLASVSGPETFNPNAGRSPVFSGPMISIIGENSLKYVRIRTDKGDREECYDLINDPGELRNLASGEYEERVAPLREALDAVLDQSEAARREGFR